MNRAARRAARFTKAGRNEHAERTRHVCEHGNWMKTDGHGNPMCPHGCGFEPRDAAGRTSAERDADYHDGHQPTGEPQ